jgi:hypothetical protein
MTDADRELALIGDHAENLHSGAMLSPGERINESDLAPEDGWLVDEGRLVVVEPPDEPTLKQLRERAKVLEIKGYTTLSPRKLQQAVADAEKPITKAAKAGVAEGDAREGGDS